jgi:hypothetical protein
MVHCAHCGAEKDAVNVLTCESCGNVYCNGDGRPREMGGSSECVDQLSVDAYGDPECDCGGVVR